MMVALAHVCIVVPLLFWDGASNVPSELLFLSTTPSQRFTLLRTLPILIHMQVSAECAICLTSLASEITALQCTGPGGGA